MYRFLRGSLSIESRTFVRTPMKLQIKISNDFIEVNSFHINNYLKKLGLICAKLRLKLAFLLRLI